MSRERQILIFWHHLQNQLFFCKKNQFWFIFGGLFQKLSYEAKCNLISKPKSNENIKLKKEGGILTSDLDTATEFNEFFINKIEKLKDNISDDLKVDPVVNLKAKMAKKNLTFALKTVSENTSIHTYIHTYILKVIGINQFNNPAVAWR